MYLEGDSPHQAVMIMCELKRFSHISNRHNMLTHLQSCDVFHTQHAIFFATLDTCAGRGVHGSGFVRLKGFFDPTYHGG